MLVMSFIKRTIRALRGRLSRIGRSENLDTQHMDMYTMLLDMYKELRGQNAESLESENAEVLPNLQCLQFKTQRRLNNIAAILRPRYSSSEVRYWTLSSCSKVGILCDRLAMEMSSRKLNCGEGMPRMTIITKWLLNADFQLDPAFYHDACDHRDDYDWRINFFYACSSHPTFPHIRVLMQHSEVKDPEPVLKAEAMAIVAKCTPGCAQRLSSITSSFRLVMLFTFSGCHVRILVDIHHGQNLRISMSKFMEYSKGYQDVWDLLTRYLGCDFNYQLTTEKLPSTYLEEALLWREKCT
ncbi:hypothetical protein P875_00064680 [Aspergillus parasiticus SU-1]|uniref:Uncharacterized protein n=1 Tax=Aspergillus parasiticus (strain ATCC 56775 / NRRL 5862 / SRRC 143 / SU-1) TaxID=1403190 RepID=A0A0F0I816_ASPPU|nr:hypothetical protein P875_00064680 [Aspergillus parasiticus SU-1]